MKPKHQRLVFVVGSVACLCVAVLLTMQAFKQNLVYFYSPGDIAANPPVSGQKIRIGGLVKAGSVTRDGGNVNFTVTDGRSEVRVRYHGMVPNLFREGQGVVAEGVLQGGALNASTVLAKHDENYMPKEVVDALKKSGHWETQYGK